MATLKLEIVTAESPVYSGEVDIVIAPGVMGQFTILPHHAAFMTMLEPGELCVRQSGEEVFIAVSGGVLGGGGNQGGGPGREALQLGSDPFPYGGHPEQGAHCLSNSALLPDDSASVLRGDFQLEEG